MRLNGSEMVIEALRNEDVKVVFGYPGGAITISEPFSLIASPVIIWDSNKKFLKILDMQRSALAQTLLHDKALLQAKRAQKYIEKRDSGQNQIFAPRAHARNLFMYRKRGIERAHARDFIAMQRLWRLLGCAVCEIHEYLRHAAGGEEGLGQRGF